MFPHIMIGSHPAIRLLAGCSFLLAASICHSIMLSSLFFILSVCLIRLLEGGWRTIIHLMKLLRWFLIPIILLHTLLSPGQLILPGWLLTATWEGARQGVWLSVHLSTVFAAALLLSRLLERSEWVHGMTLLPFAGKRIFVFQMMIFAMKKNITEQLQHLRQQWNLRPEWRMAAVFLLASFRMALSTASEQGRMLWLRWPAKGNGMHLKLAAGEQGIPQIWWINMVWVGVAMTGIMLAW